jgi:queuosine precursor transporter
MKKQVSVTYMLAGILFKTCLILSNILAVKFITIGNWAAPAGVLVFPLAYILNDVIAEVWGYKKARLIIWAGFAMNLLTVLFFTVSIALPSAPFWQNQGAYQTIIGTTPRVVFASLLAYLAGSFLNAFVLSRMKVKSQGKHFGVRAVLSTLAGESIDSFLFITIAFIGIFPTNVLLMMVVTQTLLKTTYEIIILPVTTIVVAKIKQVEGIDTFDTAISYNPFVVKEV